jgi:acetyl/propionyl-CoA carboxylase alpha subunit
VQKIRHRLRRCLHRSVHPPPSTTLDTDIASDRSAKHVRLADEAIYIGNITTSKTHPHQDIPLLINTALKVKADALHPGYGYLSENEGFAKAAMDAGLIWIGPSPESISVLGDKRSAKEHLTKHANQVPLIPGFSGKSQDPDVLKREAEKIGYPVLVKASAGGGGKGMRIVRRPEDFVEELQVPSSP